MSAQNASRQVTTPCAWIVSSGARPLQFRLPPGAHRVTLTPQPAGQSAVGIVHVPDPAADLAVVSDVDDTIVDSGIAHGLAAILSTMLLQEQSTSVPLTGAAELYRALAKGTPETAERPFFYLSTSPWNLAGFLQGFLARHRFPGRAARPDRLGSWRGQPAADQQPDAQAVHAAAAGAGAAAQPLRPDRRQRPAGPGQLRRLLRRTSRAGRRGLYPPRRRGRSG